MKTGREEWGGLGVIKLRSEKDKEEIMIRKKELKGEKVWIVDDLTWRERRSRWRFREAVRIEERAGARIWIGNNRAMIEGEWWFWDEEEEILKDRLGRKKENKGNTNMEEDKRRA